MAASLLVEMERHRQATNVRFLTNCAALGRASDSPRAARGNAEHGYARRERGRLSGHPELALGLGTCLVHRQVDGSDFDTVAFSVGVSHTDLVMTAYRFGFKWRSPLSTHAARRGIDRYARPCRILACASSRLAAPVIRRMAAAYLGVSGVEIP